MSFLGGLVDGIFGGGGGSSSATTSTSQQAYNDSRAVTSNDSHAVTDSGNTTNSMSSVSSWLQQLSDSGNTTNSTSLSSIDSHALTDSGNTSSFAQWLQTLTNSGNTSTTNSTSLSTADTHAVSSSGNTSIIYTGTDGGAGKIAEMQAQLLGAASADQLGTVRALAGLGASVGEQAYSLARVTAANSMQASSHMLDLTGELIDKIGGGAQVTAAAQVAAAQNNTSAADAQSKAMVKAAWITGGVMLVLALLHLKA